MRVVWWAPVDDGGHAVLSSDKGSVTLLNVKHDDVAEAFAAGGNDLLEGLSLRFGDDGSEQYSALRTAGAFEDCTSERIFEDKNKGMLA